MKLLILMFTFIFIYSCNQELDNVKVKSISNSKYSYNKFNNPTTLSELVNGKFTFVADVNKEQTPFVVPDSIARVEVVDGFVYFDDSNPLFGNEPYFYQYSRKKSFLLADLCSGSCSSEPYGFTWVGESLFILIDNTEVGVELAEITFEPYSVTIHDSLNGTNTVFDDPIAYSNASYRVFNSDNTVVVETERNGGGYDIDLFDIESNEYIDIDGNPGNGYTDLEDVLPGNQKITRIASTNDKLIIARSGEQPYVYDETAKTLNALSTFTILSDESGPGYAFDFSIQISELKTYTYENVDYAMINGRNVNGRFRHFLFNLTNQTYIALDAQTNPAAQEPFIEGEFIADKLMLVLPDENDTLGGGGFEKKLFFYNLTNYPTSQQTSLITPPIFDYKYDGSDTTEYDITKMIKIDDNLICFEDMEYALIHRTIFCLDFLYTKVYEFHPTSFDNAGSLTHIQAATDFLNRDYSPDAYFNRAKVSLGRLFIPLKHSPMFDYQIYEIYRDGEDVKYKKLSDFDPKGQNDYAANELFLLNASLDGNFVSVQSSDSSVQVAIDTQANELFNFSGSSYNIGDTKISDSGKPKVHYVDQDIIFGEYTRYPASVETPGHVFIIDRATDELILEQKLILQDDLQLKRIGDDFYFSAEVVGDVAGYGNVVKYNLISKSFTRQAGHYRSFQSFTEFAGELIVVAKDTAADLYRVFRYDNSTTGQAICLYSVGNIYQTPKVIGSYLYCRSSSSSVIRYDETFTSSTVNNAAGNRHPVYSFTESGSDIFALSMHVYNNKLIYSGDTGGATYWIYDPITNTNTEITRETNGNKISAQIYKIQVTPDGELYFHDTSYDDKTTSVNITATSIVKLGGLGDTQAVDLTFTNDTVNSDNGYVLYTSNFDELMVKRPGADLLLHSDITLGGNCSNILRGKPSFQHVNIKNKYALIYHQAQSGSAGDPTDNSLCFYKDGRGINLGVYGFDAKELKVQSMFEDDNYYIFQVIKVADNEGKIVKINIDDFSVSFISTFPGTEFNNATQVGKGVFFCSDIVGAYDPYSEDPLAISADYSCEPNSLFVDDKNKTVYFALNRPDQLIGEELWSYCYAPNGNCSVNPTDETEVIVSETSHEFVNNSVGNIITLTGSGFDKVNDVKIGGNSCNSLNIISDSQLTCLIPNKADATYILDLFTNLGRIRYLDTITYNPDATLAAPSPLSLSIGETVKINGTNFVPGARVFMDNTECTNTKFISDTQILCEVPIVITGTHNVKVENGDEYVVDTDFAFTTTSPLVSNVRMQADNGVDAFGPVAGGTPILINGSNFNAAISVEFNGQACTNIVVGGANNTITCDSPASVSGLGFVDLYLENPDGKNFTFSNAFEYVPAPNISSINNDKGPINGGLLTSVTGTNFRSGLSITINGNSVTAPSPSATSASFIMVDNLVAGGPYDVMVTNLDGQSATLSSAYEFVPAPTITSITPNYVNESDGGTITVTGTNFNVDDGVQFYDDNFALTCDSYQNLTATSFDCVYSANNFWGFDLSGYGVYLLNNVDAQSATFAGNLVFVQDPTFTSITPNNTDEGTTPSVTIVGDFFQEVAGAAQVTIGGDNCTSIVVAGDNQSITCNVPNKTAGTYDLVINLATGNNITIPNSFTYNSSASTPATITNVTTSKADGTYGDSEVIDITVTFSEAITKGGGSTRILLNNGVQADYLSGDNSTQLVFRYNVAGTDSDTGALDVTSFLSIGATDADGDSVASLSTPGGVNLTDNGHTIAIDNTQPSITDIDTSQASGDYGSSDTLTINVTFSEAITSSASTLVLNLSNGVNLTTSAISSTSTTSYTYNISNNEATTDLTVSSITIVDAQDAAGNALSTDLTSTTNIADNKNINILNDAPTISSLDRTQVSASGGENIQITGTNFNASATVSIDGTPCSTVAFGSNTQLTCTVPSLTAGTGYSLVVENPDNQSVTAVQLVDAFAPPTVTSINPANRPVTGGGSVTITGTNFYNGMSVTLVDRPCLSPSLTGTTQITCNPTSNSSFGGTEKGDVVVQNNNSEQGTLTDGFEYTSNPTITSINPNVIEAGVNTNITINGSNFPTLISPTVLVGGTNCTVSGWDSTSVTCSAPALAVGTYDVSITNTVTLQSVTLSSGISYENAPTVTSAKAAYTHSSLVNEGHDEGGYNISIFGTDFVDGATAQIDNVNCTSVTFVDSTELTCAFPAGVYAADTGLEVLVENPSTLSGSSGIWSFYQHFDKTTHSPERAISNPSYSGESITINGNNFRNDGFGFSVTINGQTCTVTSFDPSSVECSIPALPAGQSPGLKDIVVNNGDGVTETYTGAFRYTPYTLFNPGGAQYTTVTTAQNNTKIYRNGTLIDTTGIGDNDGFLDIGEELFVDTFLGDVIEGTHPISAAGQVSASTVTTEDHEAGIVWVSPKWAGTNFVTPYSGTGDVRLNFQVLQPGTNITVTNLTNSQTNSISNVGVSSQTMNLSANPLWGNTGHTFTVLSNKPILVYSFNTGFGVSKRQLAHPVFPRSTDLIGVNSQVGIALSHITTPEVAIIHSGTPTFFGDNPKGFSSTSFNLPLGNGSLYSGPGMRLISNTSNSIAAYTSFDTGSGNVATSGAAAVPFIPVDKLANKYVLPNNSSYIVLLVPYTAPTAPSGITITEPGQSSTNVPVTSSCGGWDFTNYGGAPSYAANKNICKIRLTTNYASGTVLESNTPFAVVFEPGDDNTQGANNYSSQLDEILLHGWDFE